MKIKLLLVLFFSLFLINYAQAAQEKKIVRVAISNQNFSNYNHQNIKLSANGAIKLIDMSQALQIDTISPYKTIEFILNEAGYNVYVDNQIKYQQLAGPLIFSSNGELQILELNRKGMPARYKGMIELRNVKNTLTFNVINIVDMQNYLRGVVSNEMPISFGLEALKAQAVAARNYANNAQINPNYDVVDSTASQVYYGANSYKDLSDIAVAQTLGIYALYNEEPITAQYFSTSAGATDDWDDVFGDGTESGKHQYLKARFDEDVKPIKNEKDAENFFKKDNIGLDVNSPKFRWEIEFDREELEEVLHNNLIAQSKANLVSPFYDGTIKLNGLKDIKVTKRTQSGKILELEILSKSGDYKVKTQLGIRRVIKKNGSMLPSTNFIVEHSGKEELPETEEDRGIIKLFDFSSDDKYPKRFKFIGGGFGHGVGMSQYGASALAKEGKTYPEILNYYYSDIKISTMPKLIEYVDYNILHKSEFYFDSKIYKKAYLYINNRSNVSEFPIKINDFVFSETKHIASKRVLKVNITEYLKDGVNEVVFAPLSREDKGRYLIYRVEFQ